MKPGPELPKDYRKICTDLVNRQGWRYEYTGKHARLYPPDKSRGLVVVPTTPGDHRAFKNFVSTVRRAGGDV